MATDPIPATGAPQTFPLLLRTALRTDPGRPLVTFYDHASGERVELSVTTYANWVAKTSSLLVEELDAERGQTIRVDLPTHWLTPVFLGAAWNVGLEVVTTGDDPDHVVTGPEGVERWAGHDSVVASALRPLGVRFAEPLPSGVLDFGVEVWSQPDAFSPWDPPQPADAALDGMSQSQLYAAAAGTPLVEPGGRLLTTANPATEPGAASFVVPLVRGGSTIWVAHADPDRWQRTYDDERATAG